MRTFSCLLFIFVLGCDESSQTDGAGTPSNLSESDARNLNDATQQSTPFISPGIQNPKAFAADEVDFPDHFPIVGISMGAASRAYAIRDLSQMTTHVVNDLLENTAVSVTYCNRTNVVRVFSNSDSTIPIELAIGGWQDNQMLIMLDGKFFLQQAKDIPLKDYPYTRTTWGEWKSLHPETRIYVTKETSVK